MNNVTFKMKGVIPKGSILMIDKKPVKFKRDKQYNWVYKHETQNSKVTFEFKKYLELNVKHWFFWQMLMFVATFFGIFNTRPEKNCLELNCKIEFDVNENTEVVLRNNRFKDEGRAVEIETTTNYTEHQNKYRLNKEVKQKLKKLKTATILIGIGFAILLVVLLLLLVK